MSSRTQARVDERLRELERQVGRELPLPLTVECEIEHYDEGISVLSVGLREVSRNGRPEPFVALVGLAGDTRELAYESRYWHGLREAVRNEIRNWLDNAAAGN